MDLTRKHENWLTALAQYVEDTESPRHFWLWGGIFTIGAALQRKVWLPYGLDPIYPNMYIMLVAPPGKCRKGSPLKLSKKMLELIEIDVAADSGSKRGLTKDLEKVSKTGLFECNGIQMTQCALSIISTELSDLLAVDPKGMIEVLTSLYDSQDSWLYKISEEKDTLKNVCVCCFFGTTPIYIAKNLPEEALYGGWASRVAVISGNKKYKRVSIPSIPPKELFEDLIYDLGIISKLTGEFQWEDRAKELFDGWYQNLDSKYKEVKDERLHSFLERIHVMVLKTAMAIRVAYSNDLILTPDDIKIAIYHLEEVLATASNALGGMGRSKTSIEVEEILRQIATLNEVKFHQLLVRNRRNVNKSELMDVLETIVAMKDKVGTKQDSKGEIIYYWKGEKK